MFLAELVGGDAFIERWTLVPADIAAGHNWITILTSMCSCMLASCISEVAYMAHIGGFIFGMITARLFETRQRRQEQGLA